MELLPFVPNNISAVIKKEFNSYKHLCVFNFGFSMKFICIYAGESIYVSEEMSNRVRCFKGVHFCFFVKENRESSSTYLCTFVFCTEEPQVVILLYKKKCVCKWLMIGSLPVINHVHMYFFVYRRITSHQPCASILLYFDYIV